MRAWPPAQRVVLWLMLTPYALGLALLVVVPAALSFGLSFTDYDALSPPVWVGLDNYLRLARHPIYQVAVGNSIWFAALAVPLRMAFALGLALLLQHSRRGVGAFRAAVYLPTIVPVAAYSFMWLWIVNPFYGPINLILRGVGIEGPAWLAEPDSARAVFVMMAVFQIGETFVLMLAALKSVDAEHYEAASIDGATTWRKFRHITLPIILPWLALLFVRDLIFSLEYTFAPSLLMTGGDPFYSTLFLPLFARQQAIDNLRVGLGSAITFSATLATLGMLIFTAVIFRKRLSRNVD